MCKTKADKFRKQTGQKEKEEEGNQKQQRKVKKESLVLFHFQREDDLICIYLGCANRWAQYFGV